MIDIQLTKQQIGIGNLMAVGARDYFTDGPAKFGFKVGSARGSTKAITITLEASDTYTVKFTAMSNRTYRITETEEVSDVYADQLGQIVYSMVNK